MKLPLQSSTDGGSPYGALAIDSSGALYGTTNGGGAYGGGTVFKLNATNGKWGETILHAFENRSDGARPVSGVTLDPIGNVYGTTQAGWGLVIPIY